MKRDFFIKEGKTMKRVMVLLAVAAVFLFFLSAPPVASQPIDYCEGNFDNDLDQDGTDAFVFKSDFGRSSLNDPCPVIECQTAEQLDIEIEQLKAQVAQLTALLANVSRDGNDITFSGVNVHIVNGTGLTAGTANGLGNLIVGYNELRNDGTDARTGFHNVVIGRYNNYTTYVGLVAGRWNSASGPYSSVSGGEHNTASGHYSSVSGGRYNVASGDYSFVGGGGSDYEPHGNKAFANYSAVLGGHANETGDRYRTDHTIGEHSSITGGFYNTASGEAASVSGGNANDASDYAASVSGGQTNIASGAYSNVSGGNSVSATGDYDWSAGGCYFCTE
jgi:hypothetical protein